MSGRVSHYPRRSGPRRLSYCCSKARWKQLEDLLGNSANNLWNEWVISPENSWTPFLRSPKVMRPAYGIREESIDYDTGRPKADIGPSLWHRARCVLNDRSWKFSTRLPRKFVAFGSREEFRFYLLTPAELGDRKCRPAIKLRTF